MSNLRDTASVTVSETVDGTRQGRGKDKRVRASKVTTLTVHPLVWKAAKRLASGDVRRIEVVDSGTVIVR